MYSTPLGISNILHLFFIPIDFIFGDIAKHRAPFPLDGSATTRFVSKGFNPLSTHSTEAKKVFRSIQRYTFFILHHLFRLKYKIYKST